MRRANVVERGCRRILVIVAVALVVGLSLSQSSLAHVLPGTRPAGGVGHWEVFGSDRGMPCFKGAGGLAVHAAGNVYIADTGNDRIVGLSPAGRMIFQWGRRGEGTRLFEQPSSVAVDKQGNVFVADTGNNRIEKLSPRGQLLASWGAAGVAAGRFEQPQGVSVDTKGNIFVADSYNHRVQKLSPHGKVLAVWPVQALPAGVALDAAGDIYVSVVKFVPPFPDIHSSFETFDYLIRKLSPTGKTLALWRYDTDSRDLAYPLVAVGPRDNIFVASHQGDVLKFSPTGRLLARLATDTLYAAAFAVHGIALDAGGNIYVSGGDTVRYSHIMKLSPTGRGLAEWGTGGTGAGQFLAPRDVGVDGQGNVYVDDTGNRRIQKLSPTGKPLAQWRFDAPILAVDAQGHVYMTDGGPCCPARLFKFSSTGTLLDTWNVPGTIEGVSVVWPDKVYVWGYVGYASNLYAHYAVLRLSPTGQVVGQRDLDRGTATFPQSIAVDAQGNVYLADSGGERNRIIKLLPTGKSLVIWEAAESNTGGPGHLALAVDRHDDVYLADASFTFLGVKSGHEDWRCRCRILKLSPAGMPLVEWGGEGSNPGQFHQPWGIAVDVRDDVYVTDFGNDRVQKLSNNGDGGVRRTEQVEPKSGLRTVIRETW